MCTQGYVSRVRGRYTQGMLDVLRALGVDVLEVYEVVC